MQFRLLAPSVIFICSLAAHADTVTSTAVSTFAITPASDTLSFTGVNANVTPGGTFTLQGSFTTPSSSIADQTIPFSFNDVFTVNGVTETLTFNGTDLVTAASDTLNISALGPVAFGNDTLTFSSFNAVSTTLGAVTPVNIAGTLTSVTPEPSSFALLGTGVLGMVGLLRKRFA